MIYTKDAIIAKIIIEILRFEIAKTSNSIK